MHEAINRAAEAVAAVYGITSDDMRARERPNAQVRSTASRARSALLIAGKRAGWRQRDLADWLGMAQPSISRLVRVGDPVRDPLLDAGIAAALLASGAVEVSR